MAELQQDLVGFWRKLGRLLDAGVPLLRALAVIEEETGRADLRAAVRALPQAIEGGKSLSDALALAPEFFSLSVRTMARTGELTGRFPEICSDVARGLEEGSLYSATTPAAPSPVSVAPTDADVTAGRLVDGVIQQACRDRASDIHFEPCGGGNGRIRLRIDGVLHELAPPLAHAWPAMIDRVKAMANLNPDEKRLPQDGRCQMTVEGEPLDLRVSSFPCVWGESLCLRLLSAKGGLLPLPELGFSPSHLDTLRAWLHRPHALILLSGPTGCGKTTTLYAALQELNRPTTKILTLEDPVEYAIHGLNQLQVRPAAGLTFATSLRAALRQDPDVIMVGEIRDRETAQIIVQVVLTGHLALSCLHTSDACGAVRRLLDIGIEPFLVNATLTGVCAQRLVRRICRACQEQEAPDESVVEQLHVPKDARFYRGRGCDQCGRTGYRGRIAVHELLEVDDELRRLIARSPEAGAIREQAARAGMVTLRQDGVAKAAQGLTTLAEILRVCGGT